MSQAERDKKVEELVKRLGLTDEEMAVVIKKLKIVEPIWDSKKREWVHGEEWQKHNAIAEAQLNKALFHPDLALIDRERKLPDKFGEFDGDFLITGRLFDDLSEQSYDLAQQDMLKAGFTHSIIPLEKVLQEATNEARN